MDVLDRKQSPNGKTLAKSSKSDSLLYKSGVFDDDCEYALDSFDSEFQDDSKKSFVSAFLQPKHKQNQSCLNVSWRQENELEIENDKLQNIFINQPSDNVKTLIKTCKVSSNPIIQYQKPKPDAKLQNTQQKQIDKYKIDFIKLPITGMVASLNQKQQQIEKAYCHSQETLSGCTTKSTSATLSKYQQQQDCNEKTKASKKQYIGLQQQKQMIQIQEQQKNYFSKWKIYQQMQDASNNNLDKTGFKKTAQTKQFENIYGSVQKQQISQAKLQQQINDLHQQYKDIQNKKKNQPCTTNIEEEERIASQNDNINNINNNKQLKIKINRFTGQITGEKNDCNDIETFLAQKYIAYQSELNIKNQTSSLIKQDGVVVKLNAECKDDLNDRNDDKNQKQQRQIMISNFSQLNDNSLYNTKQNESAFYSIPEEYTQPKNQQQMSQIQILGSQNNQKNILNNSIINSNTKSLNNNAESRVKKQQNFIIKNKQILKKSMETVKSRVELNTTINTINNVNISNMNCQIAKNSQMSIEQNPLSQSQIIMQQQRKLMKSKYDNIQSKVKEELDKQSSCYEQKLDIMKQETSRILQGLTDQNEQNLYTPYRSNKYLIKQQQQKQQLQETLSGSGNCQAQIHKNSSPNKTNAIFMQEIGSLKTQISAKSWAIALADTGEILYGYKINKKREIASLTKIMTSVVVCKLIEQMSISPKSTFVKVSKFAASIQGTSAKLLEGDLVSITQLLYGLYLPSGNDAAYTLAENFGVYLFYESAEFKRRYRENPKFIDTHNLKNPVTYFIEEMNRLARKCHLQNTVFANMHGLQNVLNKSTAADISKLSKIALDYPLIKEIVRVPMYTCCLKDKEGGTREITWLNTNKLLSTNPKVKGLKTGVTNIAGPCLSCYYEGDSGVRLISVTLSSDTFEVRWKETEALLLWAEEVILKHMLLKNAIANDVPQNHRQNTFNVNVSQVQTKLDQKIEAMLTLTEFEKSSNSLQFKDFQKSNDQNSQPFMYIVNKI